MQPKTVLDAFVHNYGSKLISRMHSHSMLMGHQLPGIEC